MDDDEIELVDFYRINPNRLDEEWIIQPKLYYHYAKKLAVAYKELEEAKAYTEVAYAEAGKLIRSTPSQYGIEKPTEGSISTAVLLQPSCREATQKEIDTRHKVEMLKVAVATLDHRKKALENIVDLRISNYHSEPRSKSTQLTDKWKERKAFQTDKKRHDSNSDELD